MQKIIQLSIILIFTFIIISFTTSPVYAQAKPMNNVENLESVLVHIVNQAEQLGLDNAVTYAARRNIPIINGKVQVIVIINPDKIPNPRRLAAAANGIEIEGSYANRVQMILPVLALKTLARQNGIEFVRLPLEPSLEVVTSEGVEVVGATSYHDAGYTGQNVKVAVLDLGFEGYEDLLGIELPSTVVAKSFYDDPTGGSGDITGGGQPHGTACAEIVYDMAPSAQLYLVNYKTEIEFGNAVDWLVSQGVDAITHSVGWCNDGDYDGRGFLCSIVNTARLNDVLWFNSVGNQAQKHYEGTFTDEDANDWHEFDSDDDTLSFEGQESQILTVFLSWNDWPTTAEDYDFYLYDEDLNPIDTGGGQNTQSGSQPPTEQIIYTLPYTGAYHLKVQSVSTTTPHHLEIYSFTHQFPEYNVPESSLKIPADADGAFAIGATYWEDDSLEDFSSQGPTNDGRIKPELAAPDGVSNVTKGSFYGTSASSPHVAGAAALLWSRSPSYTTDEIEGLLKAKALDLDPPGADNLTGWGRLALPPVVTVIPFPFFDDFETGSANWILDAPWDVTDEDAHSGDYSLTDSPDGGYANNVDISFTLSARIDLTPAQMPVLSFWNRYNLETDADYGYVEVSKDDGTNWTTLFFATGRQDDWKEEKIDLSEYTYDWEWDVRIRFRLKTNSSVTFDGWYIDDIKIEDSSATLSYPFFDDMEDKDTTEANWLPSSFKLANEGHSGTHCWKLSSQPSSVYSYLTLASTIDLQEATNPQLIFWYRYKSGSTLYVQLSTNYGQTWGNLISYPSGTYSTWTQSQVDLSNYVGLAIRIRVKYQLSGSAYYWDIDDVYIGEDTSTMVDFGQLDSPASITVDTDTATENIYGLVYEDGVTNAEGQGAGIIVQLGYGADDSMPDDESWTWVDATYDSDVDDEPGDLKFDKYRATLTVGQSGVYDYAYRYRLEISSIWTYADLDGNDLGSDMTNGYSPSQAGDLTVGVGTKPIITNLSPSSGPVGTLVTITGENFGDKQDDSTVTFNGVDAGAADSWSDTEIQIKVPEDATTGPVLVTVGGQTSNDDKIFTVGEEPPCAFADVDGDGDVDIVDIQKVAGRWGTELGDPDYVPEYDIDGDGDIDIVDIQKVAGCWGTVLPSATGAVVTNALELKPASPVQVSIQPRLQKLTISGTAMIEVKIENVVNIGAFEVTLGYDNSVVQVVTSGIQLGDFLSSSGRTVAAVGPRIDNQGTFSYGGFSFGGSPGPDGDGILAKIPLTAKGEGQTMLKLISVKLTDTDGKPIGVGKVKNGLVKVVPQETALAPNFPNPFNPDTWIPYQLSQDARVIIELYSVSGKLIRVLDLGYKEAGFYTHKSKAAYWNGRNQVGEKVASGVYFYHLKAGDFHATRKLLVTK